MDFVPLIDRFGENGALLAGGAVVGAAFGILAQRSRFCTRSAVLDLTRGRDLQALAVWAAGFAVAVLGVQLLLLQGRLNVTETRFFSTAQSLSGALIGGGLFGIGMVLARGCVSRLLVLTASGNLRALYSTLVIGLVGLATYAGFLVPARDAVSGLWSTADVGGNDLLAHAGFGRWAGVALGAVLAVAAVGLAVRARPSLWRLVGGIGVGLAVVAGWWFTYAISQQLFEPIQAESLSYIRPLATTGEILGGAGAAGLDQGVLVGTLLGALFAALAFRDFRIATFSEPGTPSILRYTAGAMLMGFGGILAVGCTIGAGFTGGSVLALSSIAGLAAMIAGAAVADRFVDRPARQGSDAPQPAVVPAE